MMTEGRHQTDMREGLQDGDIESLSSTEEIQHHNIHLVRKRIYIKNKKDKAWCLRV